VDLQRAAEIQVVLEGIVLPASRDELVDYAALHDRAAARELERIPDRDYERIDDVGEALAQVQPPQPDAEPVPRAESGAPPGGEAYLEPRPESGAVRPESPETPPQEQIEQQAKTQKKQQQAQQG